MTGLHPLSVGELDGTYHLSLNCQAIGCVEWPTQEYATSDLSLQVDWE